MSGEICNAMNGSIHKTNGHVLAPETNSFSERPSKSLSSKVAIVTGAGAVGYSIGNGRAAAIMLAEAGAHVVCVDKDGASVQRTIEVINTLGLPGKALSCTADVTKQEDCQKIVDVAVRSFGQLDILVNNVGIHGLKGNSVTVDMAGWEVAMQVNVASMILMAKYAIPAMLADKNDGSERIKGSIVNIASVNGIRGGSPDIFYPTTKGAIVNMTRAMAAHHGGAGIRVNCVCPGNHAPDL